MTDADPTDRRRILPTIRRARLRSRRRTDRRIRTRTVGSVADDASEEKRRTGIRSADRRSTKKRVTNRAKRSFCSS